MPVYDQLRERVDEALAALYRHPDQTLLAWYRYAIYDTLLDGSRPGYAARAWIDVLSAQYVLFCWQPFARSGWPGAWLQPSDMLRLAEQALQGVLDLREMQRQITRAEALADVIGASQASAQYPAWCVFEAALRGFKSAGVAHTYRVASAPSVGARAAGPDLDDASRYAAIAIAGRLVSQRVGAPRRGAESERAVADLDMAARLRQTFFWEWWLREAIPQACERS